MPHFPKPAAGSWTESYPELGTAPVNYSDSIDPAHYAKEQEAIFKHSWLNVGRVNKLPKNGSYFTKEIAVAKASIIVVKGKDGVVRAFHNICRHRGAPVAADSGTRSVYIYMRAGIRNSRTDDGERDAGWSQGCPS